MQGLLRQIVVFRPIGLLTQRRQLWINSPVRPPSLILKRRLYNRPTPFEIMCFMTQLEKAAREIAETLEELLPSYYICYIILR